MGNLFVPVELILQQNRALGAPGIRSKEEWGATALGSFAVVAPKRAGRNGTDFDVQFTFAATSLMYKLGDRRLSTVALTNSPQRT